MATTELEPCAHCGGPLWQHASGKRSGIHRQPDCPGLPARYQPKGITPEDRLAVLEGVCALLELDAAEHGLDGPSRRDWPSNLDFTAEVTVREQFSLLHYRLLRLVGHAPEGRELLQRIEDILNPPSFTAPSTRPRKIYTPPWPIYLALQRLKAAGTLPFDQALERDDELGRDARMVKLWAERLEDD